MDSSIFKNLFAGLIILGMAIGAALVGIIIGLWYLCGWLWSHLHWI